MVVDETGSLDGVKRHDYLPFGEEIQAGVGGRTTNQGYLQPSDIRQGFTGYEKDGETGLDYARARFYASAQGRFTSVDPLLASGIVANPKTWNRYAYALNNPLRFTDPTGLAPQDTFSSNSPCVMGTPGCVPINMGTVTVTASADTTITTTSAVAGVQPDITPGDYPLPRIEEPWRVPTLTEAAAFMRDVIYEASPDFVTVEGSLPVLGGLNVTLSKDLVLYGGYGFVANTGDGVPDMVKATGVSSLKFGGQMGFGYFIQEGGINPQQRDDYISGWDANITSGPVTGVFSLDGNGEPPALVLGAPLTNMGINFSHSQRLPPWAQIFK